MQKLTHTEVASLSRDDLEAEFLQLQEAFDLALKHIAELSPLPNRPRGRPKKEGPKGLLKMWLEGQRKAEKKVGRAPSFHPHALDILYSTAAVIVQQEMLKPNPNQRFGLTQAAKRLVTEHGDMCRNALHPKVQQPIRDSRLFRLLVVALNEHRRKINSYESSSNGK
jgi:hypothetical protein